jgi:plastocyanin
VKLAEGRSRQRRAHAVKNQDRIESVRFLKPGRYLVICAVHPHFVNDGMFGFVKVAAQDKDD